MGSQGGGGGGCSAGLDEQQRLPSLCRQGSLYSLTLDEVQNQLGGLGKPLGSMNLDELLKSVWSTEANIAPLGFDADTSGGQQPGSLQSQGSFTISRDLSKKTVDEVWRDIQHGKKKKKKRKNKGSECDGGGNEFESDDHRHRHERHSTLGEMTLEDFLVKAGVVAESANVGDTRALISGVDPISASQQAQQWMHNYQLPSMQPQQLHQNPQKVMTVFMPGHQTVQQAVQIGSTSILDMAYPDAQLTMSPSSLMGTLSDTQTPGRKRVGSGVVVEKVVERRQKRMIKNRESAARSRARKQAYTHELENKVSRLEEENERLRRQKEDEKMVPCAPPPEPKSKHRRTSSAPL